jgi:hypothetical protein
MDSQFNRRNLLRGAAAISASAALPRAAFGAAASSLAVAQVSGPVPIVAGSNEPYRGENEQPVAGPGLPPPDLAPYDYIEEEYFVSGMVGGQPYKTSMLVRKPRDRRKFSGLVAVETIHAQGAVPLWGNKKVWMGGGHGWVGVGSQLIALRDHIQKKNPARYASLALPVAPAPAQANPMAMMGAGPQDMISQEIMTQVGRLLKANAPSGPFGGMTVTRLLMGGASQTGGTTLRYIAQSHAGARLAGGKPVYDAYLPQMAFPAEPLPMIDAVVVHPCTEGDLMNALSQKRPIGYRDDSDGPSRYRHYEIAGDSHVGMRGITDPLKVFSTLGNAIRPGEHLSQFPAAELMIPITQNLVDWLTKGTPPPRAARIEVANGEIVRDAVGNAKGGVRSPYVDLPTVRYIAAAPLAPGENPFRRLIGLEEPIAPDRLRTMYGSRENYLRRFDAQIDQMLAGRWLFAEDAARLKREEAARPLF